MSDEVLREFNSISESVQNNELKIDEACEKLKKLDFNLLSLDEIEAFEDSEWIPDDLYVSILRGWMKNQDEKLNKIIAYLTTTKTIQYNQMITFIESVFRPSHSLAIYVKNIIKKLGIGGGTRNYQNPAELGIIKLSSNFEPTIQKFKLINLLSGKKEDSFHSVPKSGANFKISFPGYLRISLHSYKICIPDDSFGLKSWVLQGSNDGEHWEEIASEFENETLRAKGSKAIFKVETIPKPFNSFQFINKDATWANNYSIIMSKFDLNGELYLIENKKY